MRPRRPGGDGLERCGSPARGSGEPRGGGADRISIRPAPPIPLSWGQDLSRGCQDPDVDPLLEPDGGAEPDPDGGVPDGAPEPLPMSGQFLVEPELELVPEPVEELEDPEPVVPEPELPVLELDDGVVVDEPDVAAFDAGAPVPELPELPVVVDVVAALATSAPPARRPELSAPMARMLRRRIFMACVPFRVVCHADPFGPARAPCDLGSGRDRRTA